MWIDLDQGRTRAVGKDFTSMLSVHGSISKCMVAIGFPVRRPWLALLGIVGTLLIGSAARAHNADGAADSSRPGQTDLQKNSSDPLILLVSTGSAPDGGAFVHAPFDKPWTFSTDRDACDNESGGCCSTVACHIVVASLGSGVFTSSHLKHIEPVPLPAMKGHSQGPSERPPRSA